MEYKYNNNLYENNILNNTSKNISKTQPYKYFQSPSSQNKYNQTKTQFQNINPNFSSVNQTTYNKQTIYSPHSINSLKWRNLMKIDLLLLKNSRDLNLIEPNLDNLVFGQISEEDIQSFPEANTVKLIQILQTACDILLNEQQDLENQSHKLENENVEKINEYKKKDKIRNKRKDSIHRLKKEKKRDIGVLKTYLKVIDDLRNGNSFRFKKINIDVNKTNRNTENIRSNVENKIKCPLCQDEKLYKDFELKEHLKEVHGLDKSNVNNQPNQNPIQINIQPSPEYYNNNNNNGNNEELLRKMEEIQKQFQEEFTKLQEEKKREQDNHNIPSNKVDYNQQFEKIENTFKETLNDFKAKIEKSNENNKEPNIIIQNSEIQQDYYNPKNEEILRLNDELKNIKNEIDKQEKFYESKISELDSNIKTIKIDIIENKKFLEDEDNFKHQTINTYITMNNPIENQTEAIDLKDSSEKTYFNSGKLISDHDDTDEENNKKKRIIEAYEQGYKDIANNIINKNKASNQNDLHKNQIPKSTINQNTFFEINKIEGKEIIPEVSGVKETLNKNEKIVNNNINLRNEVKKNIELDNYHRRYMKRDNNYLKSNKKEDYFIETLPKNFDLNITEKAKDLVQNKIPDVGMEIFPNNLDMVPKFEEPQLKQENIIKLTKLVNSLINKMDSNNKDKEGKENNYYISIKKLLGFKGIQSNSLEIQNKPRKFDIQNSNVLEDQNYKNNLNNKNNIIEINTNTNPNNINHSVNKNNINIISNYIDPNKNAIMSGVILTDIKDLQNEEINKINRENEKLRNIKNKDNYIKDINTNISELSKKQNETIIEKNEIKQERPDKILDGPFTSIPGTGPQIQERQDKILDGPFTSIPGTGTQIQERQDKNLDTKFTSIPGTGENNQDKS